MTSLFGVFFQATHSFISSTALLSVLLLLSGTFTHSPFSPTSSIRVLAGSGFWYKNTRPPVYNYDSVAFANMTVKINLSYMDGPGQNLMTDPYEPDVSLYVGKTINRQAFDTQFVLDMSYAIGIDPHRVFVTDVSKGSVHFSWEAYTVIVQFIFLERNETVGGGPTLLEGRSFYYLCI